MTSSIDNEMLFPNDGGSEDDYYGHKNLYPTGILARSGELICGFLFVIGISLLGIFAILNLAAP